MNLNIIAPINTLGYGYTGYHITKTLVQKNKVSLFPIGDKVDNTLMDPFIVEALTSAKLFDVNAPCVRIWHQHDMSHFVGKGPHIGFPIFELDTFSEIEKHHLNSCDALFVTSSWAQNVCINNGITVPVYIVPLGVDRSVFKETESTNQNGPTVFLNCGKWEVRKGHDILIKAFEKAFPQDEQVILLMCNSNPFLNVTQESQWKKLYKNPKVRFISRLQSSQDVAKLMQSADCGVFPSRGEGWNLEALEMLSCGKQLITTLYSAHKEFCCNNNSLLVDIDDVEPAQDGIWFHGQGNWAKIGDKQINQLAEYMRMVHEFKSQGRLMVNKDGIETAKRFSWSNTAEKIIGGIHGFTNIGQQARIS
jgi:glycosyltransferase involved in cell wall biosynthesis